MKQTILVTGGTGFIGSHTTVELQQAGYDVVIVDNLSNSKADVVDGIERITGIRPAFEKVDLRDKEATEAVFKKYPAITGIIHFAASKAVGESVEKPLLYYRNNIISLVNLLELMPQYNVKGIIFSSSCTVYGQPTPENLPVTEEAPIQKALSPYGNTKQINEEIITDYIHSGAPIKSIILRYFNPIGAHPSAEIGELPNGVPMNLIPFVTQTAIGVRKQLKIFGNDYNTPDGTCIRDYIYVVDLAKAHVAAMARVLDADVADAANPEVFNIGTGKGVSTLEVVEGFEKATGVKVNWAYAPRREGDIEKVWGNVDKANKVLGWKADTPLEDVLASAWKWQEKLRRDGIM
ncbi:MAG: UDP-glucose 4-epimerase GalE [Prevotella sp.]|jgi:UDP-glucose 4-epimerase|nr:UDP-glucose 4-epimerase GalE [Prevotella sp.]MBQ2338004.1 UDP-glucose 4-epimerase GalE [Prevotella sp.]MBQ6422541.1 UDP-glucose 4-epimerase GalE [Prevotella sp.]MDY6438352.1 UDP-glucose 4-epimerase GalE [Prevotella sp.]